MANGVLHEDLMEEILRRLPAKSLLKFRCVSRYWNHVITSSRFIVAHVSHNDTAKNHRVLLRNVSQANKKVTYKLCYDNEHLDEILTIDSPFVSLCNAFLRMVGCVNGLICLSDDAVEVKDKVVIWNPVIRRFIAVPKLKLSVDLNDLGRSILGFGYDSFNNDYKVIRIAYRKNPDFESCQVEASVAVFRISTHCWEIKGAASVPVLDNRQAYLNGVIHWLAYNKLVVGFDVKTEAFSHMTLPETLLKANISDLTIAAWCDSLAVFQNGYWSGKLSLWVMKDYGVPSTWVKQFVIESYVMVRSLRSNGCVILENITGKLISYDPKTGQMEEFKTHVEGPIRSFHMKSYVESLVLLNCRHAEWIP